MRPNQDSDTQETGSKPAKTRQRGLHICLFNIRSDPAPSLTLYSEHSLNLLPFHTPLRNSRLISTRLLSDDTTISQTDHPPHNSRRNPVTHHFIKQTSAPDMPHFCRLLNSQSVKDGVVEFAQGTSFDAPAAVAGVDTPARGQGVG